MILQDEPLSRQGTSGNPILHSPHNCQKKAEAAADASSPAPNNMGMWSGHLRLVQLPLQRIVRAGWLEQVDAIEELVRLGCDAAVQDSVASTPLHVAAGEGHLEAIAKLVQLVIAPCVQSPLCTSCLRVIKLTAWSPSPPLPCIPGNFARLHCRCMMLWTASDVELRDAGMQPGSEGP